MYKGMRPNESHPYLDVAIHLLASLVLGALLQDAVLTDQVFPFLVIGEQQIDQVGLCHFAFGHIFSLRVGGSVMPNDRLHKIFYTLDLYQTEQLNSYTEQLKAFRKCKVNHYLRLKRYARHCNIILTTGITVYAFESGAD